MLPQALVSVYREYKKDTNSIASWLASTAKECGYPADLLSNKASEQNNPSQQQQPQQPATTGRLKGKARAAAKKNKAKAKTPAKTTNTTPTSPVSRYIISVKDFIPLAECISATKPKNPALSVPHAFFNTLNRVISVRTSFSEELNLHQVQPDARSDARHSYFVGILEKVREVLKPFAPTTGSRSAAAEDVDILTNSFEALKVYEPSEDFLNAPDISRPEPTAQDEAVYEAEPSPSLDDALVAFAMMCQDLEGIREFITSIWSDLPGEDGATYDPAVLAVMTNTGLEFAANIIEDMSPVFKDYGGAVEVCQQYVMRILQTDNLNQWLGDPSTQDDEYELGSVSYFNVVSLFRMLSIVPWKGTAPIYPEGSFGVYDPESDWASKTGLQKYQDDMTILTELYWEALGLFDYVPHYPISDEFIRGVKEFKETKEIPFSLVFAAQVNLDIHHSIRGYAETLVTNTLKRISTMNAPLQSAITMHKDLKSPHWSASDDKLMKTTEEIISVFLEDPMHKAKTLMGRRDPKAREIAQGTKKHRLLVRSPIITGLALYHFRAEIYDIGLALTNAWGSIILPAHLYNAVGEEGSSQCYWTDMESLWQTFGEKQFFVGRRPENIADYVTRYYLQIGVSASEFTNRRRASKKVGIDSFPRAGTRFLTAVAPIHQHLKERYQNNANRMNWSTETVGDMLSRTLENEGASAMSKNKNKNKIPGAATNVRAPPAEVLASLGTAMEGEIEELAFPYLLMHRLNWVTMAQIKAGYDGILRASLGPAYMQHEWQVPFVAGHILSLAEGIDGHDKMIFELAGKVFDTLEGAGALGICTRQMHMLIRRDNDVPQKVLDMLEQMSMQPDLSGEGSWMDEEEESHGHILYG